MRFVEKCLRLNMSAKVSTVSSFAASGKSFKAVRMVFEISLTRSLKLSVGSVWIIFRATSASKEIGLDRVFIELILFHAFVGTRWISML